MKVNTFALSPRFPEHPAISRDDVFTIFGRMAIVTDHERRLRAIFVVTVEDTTTERGVISTLDADAGTWYVDEHKRLPGIKQCLNCSRFGHVVCENKGVIADPRHFKRRRQRNSRRISGVASA